MSTSADSYLHATSQSAEIPATGKLSKYSQLPSEYIFQLLAVECLGTFNFSGFEFLREVGRRLSDLRETSFLFQRKYVYLSYYNASIPR